MKSKSYSIQDKKRIKMKYSKTSIYNEKLTTLPETKIIKILGNEKMKIYDYRISQGE